MIWHTKSVRDVLAELGTPETGLASSEAAERLARFGPNALVEREKASPLMMFLEQFKDFMIIVLMAAAVVSGIIGDLSDTIAIIVIVILNALIGFIQQYRAERAMEALKKLAAPEATVLRDGRRATVDAATIVPGDVVALEAGALVPADMRLVEAIQVKMDEAALTGESVPIHKHTSPIAEADAPLGDRVNMAYRGTLVTCGRASGVAVATGMSTELGSIATMLQEEKEVKTPLQKRLAAFGRKLSVVIFAICGIVFFFGLLRGEKPLLMLLTAISLAVAAIPEALPAVITISLALGAKKLVRQNALVRKLPAVETLGSVTYICSDKTGTLTENKMAVERVFAPGFDTSVEIGKLQADEHIDLLMAMALSNDVMADDPDRPLGDPTEVALYRAALEKGIDRNELALAMPRVAELPFDSERKCMTTVHRDPRGGFVSYTKGAMDMLVQMAVDSLTPGGAAPMDADALRDANDRMAADGLRVLGIAMKRVEEVPDDPTPDELESGLTVLGLAGMLDPPRKDVRESVQTCVRAGIRPVMITGDHPGTATAIARRLGIATDGPGEVITGRELAALTRDELIGRVEVLRVYARVAPEQKLNIVQALQERGQFVAMTGDGVNDAPALKRADIGIAMGITGTDVSKEASHMILRDDNFSTIVGAVREGRRIFDNILKFIKYTMTSNSGEIWTIFLAPFFGLPVPLLPIHILWINLATDGLPGLALAVEPAARDVMNRPPRHPKESIFAHGMAYHMVWVGLLMGAVCIVTQAVVYEYGGHWQTMVFTVLCLSQLGHAMAIRSETESLFTQGLLSNWHLLATVVFTFAVQIAIIYVPSMNEIFKTQPLAPSELAFALAISCVVFIAVEIEKCFKRMRIRSRRAGRSKPLHS